MCFYKLVYVLTLLCIQYWEVGGKLLLGCGYLFIDNFVIAIFINIMNSTIDCYILYCTINLPRDYGRKIAFC